MEVRSGIPTTPVSRRERRLLKRREKSLARLEPLVNHLLEEGETILVAAPATGKFTLLEFLTTGWIVSYLKRCVLVFTDRRILQVLTKPSYKARGSWAEIRWADVTSHKIGGFFGRNLKLTMRNGETLAFNSIPGPEFRRLREIFPGLAGAGVQSAAGGRVFRCPRCRETLGLDRWNCPSCAFEFKSRERATWFSVLIPGGGYFYTGHPVLGFFDFLVEAYLILLMLIFLFDPSLAGPEMVAVAGVFLVILVIEKMITIYHARHYVREFIPAGGSAGWKRAILEPFAARRPAGL